MMKFRVWTAIVDNGEWTFVELFPSRAHLIEKLKVDDEGFSPYYDIPIEIEDHEISFRDYMMIEE